MQKRDRAIFREIKFANDCATKAKIAHKFCEWKPQFKGRNLKNLSCVSNLRRGSNMAGLI